MPLLLTNDEIAGMLSMPQCIDALAMSYKEIAQGRAIYRPLSSIYTSPPGQNRVYRLKTMDAVVQGAGVAVIRIVSDVLEWPGEEGKIRQVKVAALPGQRWLGLILLFSLENGEIVGIFPDGVIQRMRVGATSGLAARYLARPDSATMGLIGSGWQAGSQLLAHSAVLPLKEVRVFSPNAANRRQFAEEMNKQVTATVRPVETAEEAARGVDVLVTATNSMQPVFEWDWIEKGTHIGAIRRSEVPPEAFEKSDRVFMNSRSRQIHNYATNTVDYDSVLELAQEGEDSHFNWERFPALHDLVSANLSARRAQDEITFFINNHGIASQFAAVGGLVLQQARKQGVGRDLPLEWFSQAVHA